MKVPTEVKISFDPVEKGVICLTGDNDIANV